jgi:hypothetical protein
MKQMLFIAALILAPITAEAGGYREEVIPPVEIGCKFFCFRSRTAKTGRDPRIAQFTSLCADTHRWLGCDPPPVFLSAIALAQKFAQCSFEHPSLSDWHFLQRNPRFDPIQNIQVKSKVRWLFVSVFFHRPNLLMRCSNVNIIVVVY